MPKKQTDKPKQRTQVKDLPKKKKELTKDEQKDVQDIQGTGIVILSSAEKTKR